MDSQIQAKFDAYPAHIQSRLLYLREMIFNIADNLSLGEVEETLKWGEPSYSVKSASPVRIDWKDRSPNQYFLFFNCNTKLVDTFRELYSDFLQFQGNRAIVLSADDPLPESSIRHCLELALRYKSVKHLPLLGA